MKRPTQVFKLFKVRETGNVEFWISHGIILLSTVLGVYLAAQAGYATAVQFEISRTDREGYYLRRALFTELRSNLDWADRLTANVIKDERVFVKGDEKPSTFIWDAMQQQSTTFQLAPEILSSIKDYYDGVAQHVQTMRDFTIADKEAQKWQARTKQVREAVLPVLERDMADLRAELVSRGVPVR